MATSIAPAPSPPPAPPLRYPSTLGLVHREVVPEHRYAYTPWVETLPVSSLGVDTGVCGRVVADREAGYSTFLNASPFPVLLKTDGDHLLWAFVLRADQHSALARVGLRAASVVPAVECLPGDTLRLDSVAMSGRRFECRVPPPT